MNEVLCSFSSRELIRPGASCLRMMWTGFGFPLALTWMGGEKLLLAMVKRGLVGTMGLLHVDCCTSKVLVKTASKNHSLSPNNLAKQLELKLPCGIKGLCRDR